MDILYLLIPLSALLVLGILAVFGWALHGGQFEDLSRQGQRILEFDDGVDCSQGRGPAGPEESRP
jgi:cbb3-type cytochrome oxidase maturation protein